MLKSLFFSLRKRKVCVCGGVSLLSDSHTWIWVIQNNALDGKGGACGASGNGARVARMAGGDTREAWASGYLLCGDRSISIF